MYDPPPGYDDLLSDAEDCPVSLGPMRTLNVDGVGVITARKPMPRSAAALAMASNSKISPGARLGYLNLFVRNHVGDDNFEDLLHGMMTDAMPSDTLQLVARAIATWGTGRPTSPSSH